MARRIARPLYELAQVSKEIGNGSLQARAQLGRRGFVDPAMLSGSINDMASRIAQQMADQRELLAGVSGGGLATLRLPHSSSTAA